MQYRSSKNIDSNLRLLLLPLVVSYKQAAMQPTYRHVARLIWNFLEAQYFF